jgi:hypothetical protein
MTDKMGMSQITLSDGRDVSIDLHRITMREYRAIFADGRPQADEDSAIAKACGLTPEQFIDLPQPDARRLILAFIKLAAEPLADPNSQSVSTSD